ncbi:AbiJ-NTD4 domain-containing protein [Stenotrophomonas maltophilia]|uniref:AbiJ-NTD4 domain-containing protein n=1 Tax=Stenotrophomonas maltophilia TaxID=40324 RepID=UPI003BA3425E
MRIGTLRFPSGKTSESLSDVCFSKCFASSTSKFSPSGGKTARRDRGAKAIWIAMHDKLATELGLNELSARGYFQKVKMFGNEHNQWQAISMPLVCQNFVCAQYTGTVTADSFVKERLSFIEIAFRDRAHQISECNAELPAKIAKAVLDAQRPTPRGHIRIQSGRRSPGDAVVAWNRMQNAQFATHVDELNERFRQAGVRLNYHNGFIQISEDHQIQQRIESPFWALVGDPMWKNVDTDMKTALDLRDSGGRDPAFYAARALESSIKIISDVKGWTHGGERGAHNYIDNLSASRHDFMAAWERESLKAIFSQIRNPFGHGPGSAEMPALSAQQTDWAIAACMAWIRSLIERAK